MCVYPPGLAWILDPGTGEYKVIRAFYRSNNYLTRDFCMRMQVYTIGDTAVAWRDVADPPYPAISLQATAVLPMV
jgi:hypothetical protein